TPGAEPVLAQCPTTRSRYAGTKTTANHQAPRGCAVAGVGARAGAGGVGLAGCVRNAKNRSVLSNRATAAAKRRTPNASCRHPLETSTSHRAWSRTTPTTRATFAVRTHPTAAASRSPPQTHPRRVRKTTNRVHARTEKSELTPLH